MAQQDPVARGDLSNKLSTIGRTGHRGSMTQHKSMRALVVEKSGSSEERTALTAVLEIPVV